MAKYLSFNFKITIDFNILGREILVGIPHPTSISMGLYGGYHFLFYFIFKTKADVVRKMSIATST
jgi:hypothetical protein